MENYQNKRIKQIIDLQQEDGSWGRFHSMSKKDKNAFFTTEQALRRLSILGLTKKDEPIKKALKYLSACLARKKQIKDRKEKVLNWDAFTSLMFATWIRIFDPNNKQALKIAGMWADIIKESFKTGVFSADTYQKMYRKYIPILNKNERLIGISQFYLVNTLKGLLDPKTESSFLDYIINYPNGIYYIYGAKIAELPRQFQSRQASLYLSALEQLSGYACAKEKLAFAVNWLISFKDENGQWDMGVAAKDNVFFPIANSWHKAASRKNDCTIRILNFLNKLNDSYIPSGND